MSMAIQNLRKQEAKWSLYFSKHIHSYVGRYSYTSFMRYCRQHGTTPPLVEKGTVE